MRLLPTERFRRGYLRLPPNIQEQVDQALDRLLSNPRHPSLQVKKMQGTASVWELRATKGYRVTFQIERDLYILRKVGAHDILRHPLGRSGQAGLPVVRGERSITRVD